MQSTRAYSLKDAVERSFIFIAGRASTARVDKVPPWSIVAGVVPEEDAVVAHGEAENVACAVENGAHAIFIAVVVHNHELFVFA